MGFEIDEKSPHRVAGRLLVTLKCCQVWEVQLWKTDPSKSKDKILVSSTRITCVCNLPLPEHAKPKMLRLKKYAKL